MKRISISEKNGQVIPILAISLVVIIMMVALVLDGSDIMVNRRSAQNAADAGALAGARELCIANNQQAAIDAATLYVQQNNAVLAEPPTITGTRISVKAAVSNPSFFANVFNKSTLDATALANAGCYSISSAKVLPIAWSCKKPVGQSDSPDCILNMLDWSTEMKPLIDGSPNPVTIHNPLNPGSPISQATPLNFSKYYLSPFLYVIMDSPKIDDDVLYTCADPTVPFDPLLGKVDCDINNDGVNDVLGHGERSWLDLDGIIDDQAQVDTSNGANALKNWIKGIGVPTLAIHTWLGGQTGVAKSIFATIDDYAKDHVAIIPVYDFICDTNPENKPECVSQAHQGTNPEPVDNPVKVSPGADHYFHIMGFSAFYITCVDDGNAKNSCPGASQLIADNVNEGVWDKNKKIKAIEGYFVSGYPFDAGNPGTGGFNVGVYVVSLAP